MKKYDYRTIMTRAWEIYKQGDNLIFALCLKMAWAEFKQKVMTDNKLEELAKKFGRWTKIGANGKKYDRIYFNAKDLGLNFERYNTGNIAYADIDGEKISNSECRRILASKAYFDIIENKLVMDSLMKIHFEDKIKEAIGA
jgi:hypothetical protein